MFGKTQIRIEKPLKKTRQGSSIATKRSATSRNNAKKRYRGQGRRWYPLKSYGRGHTTPFFCAEHFYDPWLRP